MGTVLVTGAAGDVAGQLRPFLRGRHRVRLADVRPLPDPPRDGEEVFFADLLDANAAATAADGVDAVVHLAGNPDFGSGWSAVAANVTLTERVLAAAVRVGVAGVVLASSVHAVGGYIRDGGTRVDPSWRARPCCLYGASKVAVEALGDAYAAAYGLKVLCLRPGWVLPRPVDPLSLAVWVSPRDLAQLVDSALASRRRDGVYFGVSANTRIDWCLDNARAELGYQPVDDAASYAGQIAADGPEEPTWPH